MLKEYINSISNSNEFNKFVNSKLPTLKKSLKSRVKKVKNEVLRIKLTEAIDYTDTATKGKVVKDKHVVALMRYYELIKEIKNVQTRKNK